jgi:hypothetical protein
MEYKKNTIYRYPSELVELDKKYYPTTKKLIEGFAISTTIGVSTYFTKGIMDSLGHEIKIPEIAQAITFSLPFLANTFMGKKLDDIIEKYNVCENENLSNNNENNENNKTKKSVFNSVFYAGSMSAGVFGVSYAVGRYIGDNLK